MGKIVFISTYRDLTIQAKALAEEMKFAVEFFQGSLDDAVTIIERVGEDQIDACISRGGTADYVRQRYACPVISLDISIYDMLECCEEVARENRRIAVTSYAKPFLGLDLIERIMNVTITEIVFKTMRELDRKIQSLAEEGDHHIIGGGSSVVCAAKYGLKSTVLRAGGATIREAFDRAAVVAAISREEKQRSFRWKTILESIYDGVIVVDKNGKVEICNPAAERIMRIKSGDVVGKYAADVIPETKLMQVLQTGQAEIKEFQNVGDVRIVTNRVPVRDHDEVVGVVATFEDVSKVIQVEHRVRKEEVAKGNFKAKFTFDQIVGQSKALMEKKRLARSFAASDLTVMIYGKSGTGKELFAQSMHNASRRGGGPFVAINCGALPPTLLESELFGYEEGAFTGARRRGKQGLFELAHTGTIFLDEIDGLSLDMQGRLLRVLQEREVMRVGGTSVIPVNIRIIAATNRHPEDLLTEQKMRVDLYYRLNVLYLELPALCERLDDVPLLARHFLAVSQIRLPEAFLEEVMGYLQQYDWPGNIRELGNVVQRLAFFADNGTPGSVTKDTLRLLLPQLFRQQPIRSGGELRQTVKQAERETIKAAVRRLGGVGKAARELGIGRTTLWRKLKEEKQRPPD